MCSLSQCSTSPRLLRSKVWILKLEVQSPRWVVGEKRHADDPLREKMGKRNSTLREKLSVSLHTHTHLVCMCDVVAAELSCVSQVRGGCVGRKKFEREKTKSDGLSSLSPSEVGVVVAVAQCTLRQQVRLEA